MLYTHGTISPACDTSRHHKDGAAGDRRRVGDPRLQGNPRVPRARAVAGRVQATVAPRAQVLPLVGVVPFREGALAVVAGPLPGGVQWASSGRNSVKLFMAALPLQNWLRKFCRGGTDRPERLTCNPKHGRRGPGGPPPRPQSRRGGSGEPEVPVLAHGASTRAQPGRTRGRRVR